ncbi:MAG: esterase [Anaerolineae bacterium]|nr:esterase [Anaerolineae bacterium]
MEEEKQPILLLHGFASSGQSAKALYFQKKLGGRPDVRFEAIDFNPSPADFRHMTTTGLIDRLRQYILDHGLQQVRLIGSSFGGTVAVHYAHRYGGVERLLLLAPALVPFDGWVSEEEVARWKAAGAAPIYHFGFERELPLGYDLYEDARRYQEFVPPAAPSLIVHGTHDETVPVRQSREYAARWPEWVRLIEIDAGHDLNAHLDFMWEQARGFLLAA